MTGAASWRLSLLIIQEGQADGKRRPHLRCAVYFDRTVVIFDNLPRDIKTESGPTFALLRRKIRIEDFRQLRLGNSTAGIFHAHVDIKIPAGATDGDGAFPFRGGLDRVDNYVLDRAGDLHGITQQRARIITDVPAQLDPTLGGHRANALDNLAHNSANGNWLG